MHIALAVSLCVHLTTGVTTGHRSFRHLGAANPVPFEVRIRTANSGDPPLPEAAISSSEKADAIPARVAPTPVAKQDAGNAAIERLVPSDAAEDARRKRSAVPPVRLTEYYSAHELDVYPQLRAPLNIGLGDVMGEGRLTVSLTLSEAGIVEEVMLNGEPPRIVEARVRDALRESRFSPALKDGRPVKSRITLNIENRVNAARPAD
jgi:hypothetical protein